MTRNVKKNKCKNKKSTCTCGFYDRRMILFPSAIHFASSSSFYIKKNMRIYFVLLQNQYLKKIYTRHVAVHMFLGEG